MFDHARYKKKKKMKPIAGVHELTGIFYKNVFSILYEVLSVFDDFFFDIFKIRIQSYSFWKLKEHKNILFSNKTTCNSHKND